jgi:methyl-accepting chemotaxis protein
MIKTSIESSESAVATNGKVMKAVEDVVAHSKEVGACLDMIVKKGEQVDTEVSQIAVASQEQSLGVGQISHAISQVEKVIQGNAASAEESASVSQELNGQAASFKATVDAFEAKIE